MLSIVIPDAFRCHSEYLPLLFRIPSVVIPNTFRCYSEYFPLSFRILSVVIPNEVRNLLFARSTDALCSFSLLSAFHLNF
jgi:hypothetical protein